VDLLITFFIFIFLFRIKKSNGGIFHLYKQITLHGAKVLVDLHFEERRKEE